MVKIRDKDRTLQRHRVIVVIFGTASACVLGIMFLKVGTGKISAMWPAAGVAAAFLIHYGKRALIPVMIGHLVVPIYMWKAAGGWPLAIVPLTYTLDALLVSRTGYRHVLDDRAEKSEFGGTYWSYFFAPLACLMPLALFTIWSFTSIGRFKVDELFSRAILMVLAHMHGLFAMGNFSTHLLRGDFQYGDLRRSVPGIVTGGVAVGLMVMAFTGRFDGMLTPFLQIFLPLPLLVIAAARLSPPLISAGIVVWCLVSTVLVSNGGGPFDEVVMGWRAGSLAELVIYNIMVSSLMYLVSMGTSRIRRQLNLNRTALKAGGISVWEWDRRIGITSMSGGGGGLQRSGAVESWQADAILRGLNERASFSDEDDEDWRCRIDLGRETGNPAMDLVCFELAGSILERGRDGFPSKAIGLLQDVSPQFLAERALSALGHQKAKLRSLQVKLAPHFLFNSLNVIRALVHADPVRADDAITSLSRLLRNSMRITDAPLIPLAEELRHIRHLILLSRLRFGNRISTRVRVPKALLGTPVPPLLLLNLVENAITHGIGNLEQGGELRICATLKGDEVHLRVRNSGVLPENVRYGVGIQDAVQRLGILFPGKAGISVFQSEPRFVIADVFLPRQKPKVP